MGPPRTDAAAAVDGCEATDDRTAPLSEHFRADDSTSTTTQRSGRVFDTAVLPSAIRSADRWVLCRFEQRDGKRTKVPYQARNPVQRAAVNEPSTWAPFNVALAAYLAGNADGLGFVLGEGITGIDLDHCIDPTTGEIAAWAHEIVAQLASYTERSPSGTGLHVLVRGELPSGGRRKGPVEMYDDGRFFTVTGDHFDGTPTEIEPRIDELAALHAKTFPPAERKVSPGSTTARQVDLDFDELVRRASAASNGPKFAALLAGDTSGYSSQSDADLAFANILAFWTKCDATRMDEVFRRSGLMRPKWDARRGQCTYGERTIAKAIEGCRDTYRSRDETIPKAPRDDVPPPSVADAPRQGADDLVAPPSHPMVNARHFVAAKYTHPRRDLLINQGGQFFNWNGRYWPPIEDAAVRSQIYHYFERRCYLDAKRAPTAFAPTKRKVADLYDALAAIAHLAADVRTPSWLPEEQDPIAPANQLIACENGLVRLTDRALFPHVPTYYAHHAVPFEFNLNAPAPQRWSAFLKSLWPDDDDAIAALQEMFGYLLSGDTSQQKIFLLVGPKRSGKGTIARLLTDLMGPHHVAGPTLASLGTHFGLQELIAKPLAIVADARLGGKTDGSVAVERLLSISGEDVISVDRKNVTAWTGKLPTRFVILTNELPRFADSSGAIVSRFVILTLSRSFYGNENPTLTDELRTELPGIFCWALDGLERLRARGRFQQPQTSREAIRDMEDLSSPVGAFVRDRCVLEAHRAVDREALFAAFNEWSGARGYHRRSAAVFGRDLHAAYPQIRRSQPRRADGPRGDLYVGIALVSSDRANGNDPAPPFGFGRCISCGDDLPAGVELAECRDCRIGREEMQP